MVSPLPGGSCRLIVNADDFGWSEGVNEAVCALYDEGVLSSTSVMVAGPALADAVARARARPGLAVGLHLALVHAPALLPHAQIPHITTAHGELSPSPTLAGMRYTFIPSCRREMRREIAAQFAAFDRLEVPWSHVDSHLHFALTPSVFGPALELCRKYVVRGFRIPEDDFALYRTLEPEDAASQRAIAGVFSALCRRMRPRVEAAGMATTRRCYGTFRTGRLSANYLCRLVHAMPDGDFELHCHPDLGIDAGRTEYEALRSVEFRRALAERGVQLTTYASLVRG